MADLRLLPAKIMSTRISHAQLNRMYILLHFPIGSIKRIWLRSKSTIFDDFLGTNKWREGIDSLSNDKIFRVLIDVFKEQLKSIGYPEEGLRMAPSAMFFYRSIYVQTKTGM